ncbi:MAG: transposase [Bacteroidota bacterium]
MDKFRGRYRIASARAQWWDYGADAAYFITICTRDREHFFGQVERGQMILSDIGKIVNGEWEKTFQMRPDMNLGMGQYVVMPNHFHAIIIIGRNEYNTHVGSKQRFDAMENEDEQGKNRFGPQSKNLASIVRGFKSGVTKRARLVCRGFEWQSRYHDHIIRDPREFAVIENYIRQNPRNWDADKLKL